MERNSADGNSPDFRLRALPWKRILIGAAAAAAALLLLLAGIVAWLIVSAPDIDTISVSPAESATYICDEDGNYLRKLTLAESNRDIVTLEQIPDSLEKAIIAIEDERFYEHGGIDLRGIARAFFTGIQRGSFSEGASTITQQLVKNSVFTQWTQENSFFDRFRRKVQEQYLALQLEDRISKDEILEDYLNTINLGAGCYGVQAASRRYFGKDVSDLALSEAAVLAAIPQNPSAFNPIVYPEANRRRAEIVLSYMEQQGYISAGERQTALADDVYARISAFDEDYEENTAYTYYEDALIDQVMGQLTNEKGYSADQAYRAVYSGGLRIFSAQDQAIQQICDEEFQNPSNFPEGTLYGVDYALSVADENGLVTHYGSDALRRYIREEVNASFDLMCSSPEEAQEYADAFREHITEDGSVVGERLTLSPQPQASLTVIDQHTGYVRAIVGGRGEKSASLTLNRATGTTRQPGSTFKILTAYAPAIDSFGQTLATVYENEPYKYEDGTSVSNWDITDYSGEVTVREAITRSINVIAVKCITEITPRAGLDCARRLGISTLHETYETADGVSSDLIQPLALGGITEGVTNLELCNAYAAIANGGVYNTPKFFTKVLDRNGTVILDNTMQIPESGSDASALTDNSARVLQASTAFLLTDAMRSVVSDPSGTAYGTITAAGQPVAGKTGTTSNYKDIWFVGYTPCYTCCVWGGYDNNQELPGSSTYHTYNRILWSAVMGRIHNGLPPADFTVPDGIVQVSLCKESHLRAVDGGCPDTYEESFAAGTEPDEECALHDPVPETEPILIYQDILDQLLPETEAETEAETDTEIDTEIDTEPEIGTIPDSDTMPDSDTTPGGTSDHGISYGGSSASDSVTLPGAESPVAGSTPSAPDAPSQQPDTTSFDDLLNRLAEESRRKSGS